MTGVASTCLPDAVRPSLIEARHAPQTTEPVTQRAGRPRGAPRLSPAAHTRTEEIDHAFLAAAQRGDEAAFLAIMRHYDRLLRIVAFHVLRDRQLMDDVLQDVTLRAYRSLRGFRGDAALGTWLSRITYRVACDAVRRNDRCWPVDPEDLEREAAPEDDPADALAARSALAAAFAALSAEQRLAVLLVDREGYDYAATARILDIPAGTLASRLSAARSKLRRQLADHRKDEVPT